MQNMQIINFMGKIEDTRRKNARQLAAITGGPAKFARKTGLSDSRVSQIIGENFTRNIGNKTAQLIESSFGKPEGWLDSNNGQSELIQAHQQQSSYDVILLVNADDSDEPVGEIEYWDARGSCGGGFLNHIEKPKGKLIKEASFFSKYDLNPKNAFAIYADGESMAEFINDGDMVIFNRAKTTPISGKIFAIEHPDGLRIKMLRRSIDGSWILESKNTDKRRFPDEVIPAEQEQILKIIGQYVYRQG